MSDKRFESSKAESPNKFTPALAIGAGLSIVSGIAGAIGAGRQKRKAEAKERESRREMNRLKAAYANIDISNPFANLQNQYASLQNQYANMENTAEDLTVNQQQAEFERDSFQRSQANIMGNFRGAAGGSGIAALAQSLAQQGQIAAQRSAASIGAQESKNQQIAATQAGRIQEMERRGQSQVDQLRARGAAQLDFQRAQGEQVAQQRKLDRAGTMLGMSQQETAAYMQQGQDANRAKWDAISGGISNVASFAGGDGTFGFGTGTNP